MIVICFKNIRTNKIKRDKEKYREILYIKGYVTHKEDLNSILFTFNHNKMTQWQKARHASVAFCIIETYGNV